VPPGLAATAQRQATAHSVGCYHIPVAVTGHDPAVLSKCGRSLVRSFFRTVVTTQWLTNARTNVQTIERSTRSARNSGVIFDLLSWPGLHRPGLAVQGMAGLLVSIIACRCLVVRRM
jgi:hypothetical protein